MLKLQCYVFKNHTDITLSTLLYRLHTYLQLTPTS